MPRHSGSQAERKARRRKARALRLREDVGRVRVRRSSAKARRAPKRAECNV